MRKESALGAVALLAVAAVLPSCRGWSCRDGDIGSKNCLAERGGLGQGVQGALGIAENVAWWPYKIVSVPATSMVQGAVGWYEVTGEPVSATLTWPVGAAIGLAIGAANWIGQEPIFVERDDNFWDVLANPYLTDQEVWKDTTPPHARPRYAPPGPVGGWPESYDVDGYSEMGSYPPARSYNLRVQH